MAAVRRYAMLKAPSLAPSNNAAWARILERIFRREDDAEVLGGALNLLSQVRFAEQPDHALALSSAIARRLLAHGAVGGAARDRTEDRVRMAQAIASLRARTEEFRTLLDHSAELETPVLAELVRALGRIDGASTMEILGYFRQGDDGSDRGREIRIAAVDALGRPGLGAAGQDGDRAGAALREMLGGEGDLGIGRVDDPRVRLNALRSLGNHPGEATADLLRRLALGSDEAEAKVAIVVLRKIAVSGANAVGALAEIVIDETAATPRRIEALQALAGMKGAAQEDAVVRARGTARRVLESKADVEVRKEAARTAAALADPTALDAVAGFWLEAPADEDRRIAFRDLIDAVASTGEGQDVAIARTLDGLRGKAPKAGLEALTRSLLERHPRNPFRRVMCLILLDRAQEEGTPPDAARAALEEADLLLQAILGPEPQDDEYGALGLRVRVKALLGDLAKDAAAKKTHWLEAVRLAARSTDPEVATEGRAVAEHFDDPKLSKALTPDERRRLGEDRAALEKVLVGRTPPDR